jgi:hypothetical protein
LTISREAIETLANVTTELDSIEIKPTIASGTLGLLLTGECSVGGCESSMASNGGPPFRSVRFDPSSTVSAEPISKTVQK